MKLAVGVGNPYFGDDAVGIEAVRLATRIYNVRSIELPTTSFELLDSIEGCSRVVIVDSILGTSPGKVHVLDPGDLEVKRIGCTHGISLAEILAVGREIMEMPEVVIIAVEVNKIEQGPMSEHVKASVRIAADLVGYELCYR